MKRAADPILTTSKARENGDLESSSELSSDNGSILSGHESTEPVSDGNNGGTAPQSSLRYQRKRKHKLGDDDVEGAYMQKLAREEAREDAKSCKRQRLDISSSRYGKSGADRGDEAQSEAESVEKVTGGERGASPVDIPQHESVDASQGDSGVEKASRTVFLGNVSTEAIKSKSGRKAVLEHLASFLPLLPKQDTSHKVDSLRFRSTAFSSSTVPKKVAFARKELMESTTQNTNAYAVYSTQLAAREAAKRLNGTIVLGRHLRVDSVAHPAKVDHRRCVFIGNLGFVDDESETKAAEDEASGKRPRKGKVPADLEEGLWRQFGKAGSIESIRVPRDKTTRVGKGFAYVQFLVLSPSTRSLDGTDSVDRIQTALRKRYFLMGRNSHHHYRASSELLGLRTFRKPAADRLRGDSPRRLTCPQRHLSRIDRRFPLGFSQ